MNYAIDGLGWLGAAALLLAYGLQASGLRPGARYHGLNLAGAAGLAAASLYRAAYPAGALNAVWVALACLGLARALSARRAVPTD